MTPTGFKECNKVLHAPEGTDIMNLPIHTDGRVCSSVWEFSDKEIDYLIKHKKIKVRILSGVSQPPMIIELYDSKQ